MPLTIDFDLPMLEQEDNSPGNSGPWLTLAGAIEGKGRWVLRGCCGDTFGDIEIRLEPYHGPHQFQLIWQVTDEQIPRELLPGVVEGVRQAARSACTSSGLLTNIKITVAGGMFHPVDSGPRAFTRATQLAFEDALKKAELVPAKIQTQR